MTHLEAFQQKLTADAALISSWQNQFYLSHFKYDDGYLLIFADEAYLLADFRYIEAAEMQAAEGFTVLRPEGGMLDAVQQLLAKRGAKSLLLEENDVTLRLKEQLQRKLPGVELLSGATALLSELHMEFRPPDMPDMGVLFTNYST